MMNPRIRIAPRDALDHLGWTGWFDNIVISGEVGVVKPHPRIYEKNVAELGVAPGECVYIGDNWLGDVDLLFEIPA